MMKQLIRWRGAFATLLLGMLAATIAGIAYVHSADGQQRRKPLVLRQPGSPWADHPNRYDVPAGFEKNARRAAPRDHFKVLDYPPFVTAEQADANNLLAGNLPVLGVAHNGVAKAYPIQTLGTHELCNDSIADEPIATTY